MTDKTTLNTSALKTALKLVMSGTGTDQALEGADSILFSGGAVHAYNGAVSVSIPVKDTNGNPIALQGCVKAKTFSDWVNKVKAETVTVSTLEDGSWEVTAGKSKLNPTRFEDPLTGHLNALNLAALEWIDLPQNFHSAMSLTRLDNQKTTAPFVLLSGTCALASDGVRFNSCDLGQDFGTFALHTNDLKALLQSTDILQISVAGAWVHFLTASGTVWTVRKMDGSTYRTDRHLNALKLIEASIDAKTEGNIETDLPVGLEDAVDKLGVYAAADKVSGTVRVDLHVTSDGLALMSSRTEGSASEALEWPEPLPAGVDLELAVSGPFLKEAASRGLKLHIVQLSIQTPTGPKTGTQLVFKGTNFTQAVTMLSK